MLKIKSNEHLITFEATNIEKSIIFHKQIREEAFVAFEGKVCQVDPHHLAMTSYRHADSLNLWRTAKIL